MKKKDYYQTFKLTKNILASRYVFVQTDFYDFFLRCVRSQSGT